MHVWRDQVCYKAYTCRHSDNHWSTSLQCLAIVLYARKAAHKNIHVEHKIQVWRRVNPVTMGYIQGVCLCLSRSDCLLSFYRFSFAAWLVHAPLHASIQRSITLLAGVIECWKWFSPYISEPRNLLEYPLFWGSTLQYGVHEKDDDNAVVDWRFYTQYSWSCIG